MVSNLLFLYFFVSLYINQKVHKYFIFPYFSQNVLFLSLCEYSVLFARKLFYISFYGSFSFYKCMTILRIITFLQWAFITDIFQYLIHTTVMQLINLYICILYYCRCTFSIKSLGGDQHIGCFFRYYQMLLHKCSTDWNLHQKCGGVSFPQLY